MDPTDEEFAGAAETGEQTDVMGLHAPMMREQEEPKDGLEATPFWLLVVIAAILLWGGYYLGEHTGDFRGDDLDQGLPTADLPVKELTPLEYGRRQYNGNCAACHGAEGTGQGKADGCPPLAGSEWVVGTGAGAQSRLARIVLHGLTGPVVVKGQPYSGGQMPNWSGGKLGDSAATYRKLAAILTYVRSSWGNAAGEITPEFLEAVDQAERAKGRAANQNWTGPELEKVTADEAGLKK
jgi:mono/diheme cytochrome c family protein